MKNTFLVLSLSILAAGAAMAQTKADAPKAAAGAPNLMDPSTMNATAPATFLAQFETTKGSFTIKVTRAWAPHGADHFYNLVRAGYFTDAGFFRVVPGFMVQFGISARPEVSRLYANANIQDDPVKESNVRGMVTFAQTSARNSRSTQLFINFADNSRLDADRFAPFGEVTKGMDVVDKIYSGYGEQPDQGAITTQGKAYLDKAFPRLDHIVSATIVTDAAKK
jgi:peptidyl-prolyl cis-trans isomerase A (cyclophilin A)